MAYFATTNTGSQSHSQNVIGHSGVNFSELLKPISNLAKVWEIDITPYINDFFASFLPEEIPDFRTAATLVLGAAAIFGKKVDFLYEQLQQVLFNTSKQRRRRSSGQTGSFVLDLDVDPRDFDLSDFYESANVQKAESLCLRPKLPQTSLSQRQINENDDYRVSPVYNSIVIENAIVFEQWDAVQLRNALCGKDSFAQPIIFSTPIPQHRMEEAEQTAEQIRAGQLEAVMASTFVQPAQNYDVTDADHYSLSGRESPREHNQEGLACDLDFQALDAEDCQPLEKGFNIVEQSANFALELAAFRQRRTRGRAARPQKYKCMQKPVQTQEPITNWFLAPSIILYQEQDQDINPETLDFQFFQSKNLESHVVLKDFFATKVHTSCCKRAVAAQMAMEPQPAPVPQLAEMQGNVELNFDFQPVSLQPKDLQSNKTFQANQTETLRQQLAQRNRSYRKLEVEQFLKWVNFKIADNKCDITEIQEGILEKLESGPQNIRAIAGAGDNLARTFIGSLLMASNGQVEIEIAKTGDIIVQSTH